MEPESKAVPTGVGTLRGADCAPYLEVHMMDDTPPRNDKSGSLRRRADEMLHTAEAEEIKSLPPEEAARLLHELRIHQIELEMQNEELRRVQSELEASRDRYADLYDFAPVGYLTLSERNIILEANLAAATMLGMARSLLIGQSLTRFIAAEDQDIFYFHRQHFSRTPGQQACELRPVKPAGSHFHALLETIPRLREGGAMSCRVTISDITARKQVETESTELRERLAEELADMKRLHEMSAWILNESGIAPILRRVLEASRDLLRADMGYVQIYDAQENTLKIAASVGLNRDLLDYFGTVPAGFSAACGPALERRARVIVEDVFADPLFKDLRPVFAAHGISAAQSTPLFTCDGEFCGTLTTLWNRPRRPSERELRLLDLYAQQAMRALERWRMREALEIRVRERTAQLTRANEMLHKEIAERKQAEEALRDSEAKYSLLVENSRQGILVLQDGKLQFANSRAIQHSGYSMSELCSLPFLELVHPDDRAMVAERYENRLRGMEIPEVYQFRFIAKQGLVKWVEVNSVRITWKGREAALSFLSDIEERKLIEEALKRSEEKYRALFTDTLEPLSLTCDGRIVDVNRPWLDLHGYGDAKEVQGRDIIGFIHPDDRHFFEKRRRNLFEDTRKRSFQIRDIRKDGAAVFVEIHSNTLLLENRRMVIAAVMDVTERKRTEEALQESELRYRQLFAGIGDAVLVYGPDNRFLDCNNAALKRLGYDREEFLCLKAADIVHPDFQQVEKDNLERIYGGEATIVESAHCRKDGQVIPVEIYTHRIEYRGEQAVLSVVRDITARKAAAEELRKSHFEIVKLSDHLERVREEEKARLAREIHDELGQALTGLKMDAVWIAKKTLPTNPELKAKASAMARYLDAAVETVRRISFELRPPLLDDLGLPAALERLMEDFGRRTEMRVFMGRMDGCADLSREQASTLYRIAQEALTNAARHAAAASVKLSLINRRGNAILTLRDNGCGLDPDRLQDPQCHGILGMRERARMAGGSLEIKGIPGKGTRVEARVPVRGGGA
jgi:two-component system sensor histidine kinase UhpB